MNSDSQTANFVAAQSGATRCARPREVIVAEICSRIADGEALIKICGEDREDDYPPRTTFYDWKDANPEFEKAYVRAMKLRVDKYVEETFSIADDGANDWMLSNAPNNPGYVVNGEHVQRSKIRISQRNWYAEKICPRIYGQKVAVGGADDLPPMQSNVTVAPAGTPEEVYRAMLTGGVLAKPVEPEQEDLGGYV